MKKPTLAHIPWNLVTKNLHGHELLRKKLHQKITKLERHLKHFPPDTVHLHIALERHPLKTRHTAALTLRLPANILRSEKSSPDVIQALDLAVKALLRELESLKADLRREAQWKRKAAREKLRALKSAGFAPEPQAETEGPQNLGDVIRALLDEHHPRLLRYVRRQLWHDVTAGELPPNTIDPRAVVDEVARQALADPHQKPAGLRYVLWFYSLARRELARRRKTLKCRAQEVVPLQAPRILPDDEALVEGYDAEQPLDIIERQIEPPVVETRDLVADPRTTPPDQVAVKQDLLAEARRLVATWPAREREVFELHFVEGFEPWEVALIIGSTTAQVEAMIRDVQNRLRDALLAQVAV